MGLTYKRFLSKISQNMQKSFASLYEDLFQIDIFNCLKKIKLSRFMEMQFMSFRKAEKV